MQRVTDCLYSYLCGWRWKTCACTTRWAIPLVAGGGRGEVPAAEAPAGGEVHDDPRAAEEVPDETEAELEQVTESDSDDWEFVDS